MAKNLCDYVNNEPTSEEDLKQKINKYSNLSQKELMSTLFSEVESAKNNGTFNMNQILSTAELMKQYLTPQQQQTLNNLINKIK